VERASIYRGEGQGTIAEQLAGQEPRTQFGRAMDPLGVELILAHRPPAKGRVERIKGVLQDRLVKELRRAGISDRESANRFLRRWRAGFNRRFERKPASEHDAHRPAPKQLNEGLRREATRVVQADWTVACGGRWYQLGRQPEALNLGRRKVIVRTLRDGRQPIEYRGQKRRWRELPGRPQRASAKPVTKQARVVKPPGAEHPWRRFGMATGREYWQGKKARGRASREPARLGGRASARPPLRSGLPTSRPPSRKQQQQRRGHSLPS